MPRRRNPSVAVEKRMLAMLEWASPRPTRWHDVGKDEDDIEAAKLLEDRGVIEVSWIRRQYKLTPK